MKKDTKQEGRNVPEEIPENSAAKYRAGGAKKHGEVFAIPLAKNKLIYYVLVVLVIFVVLLFCNALKVIFIREKETYNSAKENNIQSVYNSVYENSFRAAEEKTHVSNSITIRIEDVREMANLEVLRAGDVEYVVTNKEDHPDNITSWIEVPGTGIFTVDLSCAEFIVDSRHQHVLIRVPQPVLTDFKVDIENTKQLLWRDDIFNGSVKVGEDEMRNQISEGVMRLKEYLTTNRMIHENAVNSAKNMIESFLKQLNPEISDLTVEVEFIEDI